MLDALLVADSTAVVPPAAAQEGKNTALCLVVEHGKLVSLARRVVDGGANVNGC